MDEREKEEAEQKEKQRKAKILADEKTEPRKRAIIPALIHFIWKTHFNR